MQSGRVGSSLLALFAVAIVVPLSAAACRKSPGGTVESCSALTASGVTMLGTAIRGANAGTKCLVDGDCVEAPVGLGCLAGCGGNAIPSAAASSFASALRSIDESTCKPWSVAGCASVTPLSVPSCPRFVPRCRPTGCEMVVALSPPACSALMTTAQKRLDDVAAGLDTTCTTDGDCMKIGRYACHDDYCGGGAIATRAKPAHEAAMKGIDDGPCKEWRDACSQDDPMPSPSCVTIPVACSKGRCVPVSSTPPSPSPPPVRRRAGPGSPGLPQTTDSRL